MRLLDLLLRRDSTGSRESELHASVKAAMSDIQAYARTHGGRIHLVGVTNEGEVKVRLTGACDGCPMADLTIRHGIEAHLRQLVPGITKVSTA